MFPWNDTQDTADVAQKQNWAPNSTPHHSQTVSMLPNRKWANQKLQNSTTNM
jgi:hypothetical protein